MSFLLSALVHDLLEVFISKVSSIGAVECSLLEPLYFYWLLLRVSFLIDDS